MNKIPFLETILSNENFDNIQSYENHNLKIERINDRIEISYKLTYSTNVFIYEKNNKYWISLNPFLLYKKFDKDNIIRHYDFYDKLILTKDKYEFVGNTNELYMVPINSEEGLNILKNWIDRYKILVESLSSNLYIDMSGGIDTRNLSYFWRNINNNFTIFTIDRNTEVKQSIYIINYINDNFNANTKLVHNIDDLKNYIGLSGNNIVHGLYVPTIYEDFINRINNPIEVDKKHDTKYKSINKDIVPYYDKEYLKLKCDYPGQLKIVLFYCLCQEQNLNKLPIISFKQENIQIMSIEEFVNYYKNNIYNKKIYRPINEIFKINQKRIYNTRVLRQKILENLNNKTNKKLYKTLHIHLITQNDQEIIDKLNQMVIIK